MMIRVNNSTWVRTDDIVKLYVKHDKNLSTCQDRFTVDIYTNDGVEFSVHDTLEQARNAAQRIADQINNAEAKHVED